MDGQDYYPVGQNQISSTTNPFTLNTRAFASFKFASSTIGGTVLASGLNSLGASTTALGFNQTHNRNHYSWDIPVRMRYVRAFATIGTSTTQVIGTGNGAVWMQIVPRQEVN